MKTTLNTTAALLLALATPSLAVAGTNRVTDGKLVIEAGKIITQAGDPIEDGVIVIENGRITAIGRAEDVEVPWDAAVVGGADFVAFPGFVEAHSSSGMDRANENLDVAPFLSIRDSIDPVAFYFEDCLRYGITTINVQHGSNCVIGAQGMIVRPTGMTVEEMVVRPSYGLKVCTSPKSGKSRATQMQLLRHTFDGLRRYLGELVETERDEQGHALREARFQGRDLEGEEAEGREMSGSAWQVEGLELIPRGAIDEKQAPLLEVVEGRRTCFINCANPVDVPHALDLARENGFLARTVLVISPACWRAADLIAEAGVPVVLTGGLMDIRRDPITGEEIETFVPAVLAENGVRFALSSADSTRRSLWYQAALAISHGLDRELALDAVTRVSSEILGLGQEVGSLEVGKLGNVVLFTGDPLSVTSWVEHVVIEGEEVYTRAADVRNKQLLDGTQPQGTSGGSVDGDADDEHKHDDDGDEDGDGDGEEDGDDDSEDKE